MRESLHLAYSFLTQTYLLPMYNSAVSNGKEIIGVKFEPGEFKEAAFYANAIFFYLFTLFFAISFTRAVCTTPGYLPKNGEWDIKETNNLDRYFAVPDEVGSVPNEHVFDKNLAEMLDQRPERNEKLIKPKYHLSDSK